MILFFIKPTTVVANVQLTHYPNKLLSYLMPNMDNLELNDSDYPSDKDHDGKQNSKTVKDHNKLGKFNARC